MFQLGKMRAQIFSHIWSHHLINSWSVRNSIHCPHTLLNAIDFRLTDRYTHRDGIDSTYYPSFHSFRTLLVMISIIQNWILLHNFSHTHVVSATFWFQSLRLHSFPKETQHFWSCPSFGEECIPVNLGLYIVKKTDMQISHDPRLHDPDPGPQEKSTKKSCVSLGKGCKWGIPQKIWDNTIAG